VVVSTHAVLKDALTHGFVNIGTLALLVFDEGKSIDAACGPRLMAQCSSPRNEEASGKRDHAEVLSSNAKGVWNTCGAEDPWAQCKPS